MQQVGTRWAHRDMQRVGRKEETRFTILLHEAANAIVSSDAFFAPVTNFLVSFEVMSCSETVV
jgi:hypothetical protein